MTRMMCFKMYLLKHGKVYQIFEKIQTYTHGYIELPPTNQSPLLIKKKKENNISIDDESYQLHAGKADYLMDCEEIQEKLEKALLTLPEKQRAVFHMKYYEDMKYTQISEVVGTSVGALKASYHIAVKKIENYLIEN